MDDLYTLTATFDDKDQDKFDGSEMTMKESLDEFFEHTLVIDAGEVKAQELLGSTCAVEFKISQKGQKPIIRHFHGYCVSIKEIFYKEKEHEYNLELTIRPFAWLLTKNNAYRVFQNKKTQDIILTILKKYKFKEKTEFLIQDDPVINYCIQYAESDWAFILRLVEKRGWSFLFKQEKDTHTLCFFDNDRSFAELEEMTVTPPYIITDWERHINLPFLFADVITYDHTKAKTIQAGSCKSSMEVDGNRPAGTVIYPGEVNTKEEAITAAKTLMGAEDQQSYTAYGKSKIMQFAPGIYFTFDKFKSEPDPLLIWEVEHKIVPGESEPTLEYSNSFTCCKKGKKWFSKQASSPPIIPPLQIARVTGSEDKGIFSNEKNQVKIQFPWDMEGKYDDNSSCWVNVQSPVAGEGSGIRVTPNIGDDVLVGFTPDYTPLIVGSIYSGDRKAPFDKITQQGLRFRSVPSGGENDYSALCFECKSGEEAVVFQSNRDMLKQVNRDDSTFVEGDRVVNVKGEFVHYTEKNSVVSTAGTAKSQVDGDNIVEVKGKHQAFLSGLSYVKTSGDYQVECEKDIEMVSKEGTAISSKDLVLSSSQNALIKAGNSKIAMTDAYIELVCGSQKIVINSSGILINGASINIAASLENNISGLNTSINSQAATNVNGTMVNISGKAQTTASAGGMLSLFGGITQINCTPGVSPPPQPPAPPPPPPRRFGVAAIPSFPRPDVPSAGDLPVEAVLSTYDASEAVLKQAQPGMTVDDLLDRLEQRGMYQDAMELQHHALDAEDSILLGYHSVSDGAGNLGDFMHGAYSFAKGIPDFFTKGVPDFFTKDIPDFFTKDIPGLFTKGIPNFFTKDIPDYFSKDHYDRYRKGKIDRLDDLRRRGDSMRGRFDEYRGRAGAFRDRFDEYRGRAGAFRGRFDEYRGRAAGAFRDRFGQYPRRTDPYRDQFDEYPRRTDPYRDLFDQYRGRADAYRDQFDQYRGQVDAYRGQLDEYRNKFKDYRDRFNNYDTPHFFAKKPSELLNQHFPSAFSSPSMSGSKVDLLKKQFLKNYSSSDLPNMALVQKYLSDPSAANRQHCLETSLKSKKTTPGNLLLKGIGLSGQHVTFPDSVSIPTPPKVHAPLIAGAVNMAAAASKTKTAQDVYKNGCKAGRLLINNQKGRKAGMSSAEKFSDAKACLTKHGLIAADNPINKPPAMEPKKTEKPESPSLSSIIDNLPPESKPDLPLKKDASVSSYVSSLMENKQHSQAATTLCYALPPKDAISAVHSQINKNNKSLMANHIDNWLKTQDKDSLKNIKKETLKTPTSQPNYMLGQAILLSSDQKDNEPETPATEKLKAVNSKLLADIIAIAALSQKSLAKDIATEGLALLKKKKSSVKIPEAASSLKVPVTPKTVTPSDENKEKSALGVVKLYDKKPENIELLSSQTYEDYIISKKKNGQYKEAILFIAHALEPLSAVFWCYTCVRQANLQLSEEGFDSLHAVHDFILQPTNDRRKLCGKAVAKNLTDTPCSWLARSAYWCFGDISPDGEDGSEPATVVTSHHYSYATNSAMHALVNNVAPDKQKYAYNDWIDFALTLFKSK